MGAPRSGTSWLQAMLGGHPEVASPSELHLFDRYVRPWHQSWERQVHPPPGEEWRRLRGLPSVLTRQDFDAIIARFIDTVHRRVMDAKPSATVLLEKTPDYSLHVEDIARYVPEPRFIHLIRDGRDVVASLLAASEGWGKMIWADESIESAAGRWKSHVLGARLAGSQGHPYVELRYEALLGNDGPRLLQETFGFCGVEASDDLCSEIYAQHRFDRMQAAQGHGEGLLRGGELAREGGRFEAPEGFLRRGTSGEWRELWSGRTCWRFDQVAGSLLRDLGYAYPGWVEVGRTRRLVYETIGTVSRSRRVLRAITRRAKKLTLG